MSKRNPLEENMLKPVEVICKGIRYRGTLQGADENLVYLKGPEGYHMLPMDQISSLRGQDEPPPELEDESGVSADFFTRDDEEAEPSGEEDSPED